MASQTFGTLAQGAIAKYLKQATSYESTVLADRDPEDLHQMRVGLRRLRTALQVFAVGIDLPKAGREPKVANIGQRLGRLRDLDVIGDTLRTHYLPRLPENEQLALLEVIDRLADDRQRAFKVVKKLLDSKPYRAMKQALGDWVKTPSYRPLGQWTATAVVPDVVLPLMADLWLHPGWWVGAKVTAYGPAVDWGLSPAEADALMAAQGDHLHNLRKQIKRVRYQLRVVAPLYGDALDADLERLSAMQDTLGNLQDSVVLESFMAQVNPDPHRHLPVLRDVLTQSRHQAWQQWQAYQKHYLEADVRQDLRLTLLQPGTQTIR
jgi:CHAD domain-containing protein